MISKVRHLAMEELLALRDGEGSEFACRHVESCELCRSELERLYQVRAQLRALPRYRPPRDIWVRVADQVRRRRRRRRLGLRTAALAVAAALTGLVVLRGPANQDEGRVGSWLAEQTSQDLGPMIVRSQELEGLLRTYKPQYRVYDAPTALAVSALEDRIGILDRMLIESRAVGADREVLVGLWGERVEALETLVGLQLIERPEGVWR
ncbi:MAG: hypothetical protein PVJ43_03540 [Gemmatimonadales bacterium]